jgi:hypothetical protein
MSDDTQRPVDEPFGETEPDFEETEGLPDHTHEELEIEDGTVPDPEDALLEPEDTEYTDPDV